MESSDGTFQYESDNADQLRLPVQKHGAGASRRWVSVGNDRVRNRLAKPKHREVKSPRPGRERLQ
eukprot:3470307-Amphidinium_carterae.1